MTDLLNIEVVKRKAGCEHFIQTFDHPLGIVAWHSLTPETAEDAKGEVFVCKDDDGTTRPWVTEVITWIRGLHT